MPKVSGLGETPRRLAPVDAFHGLSPRCSTPSWEGRRENDGEGEGRKQQKKQQQQQHKKPQRSSDPSRLSGYQPLVVDVGCISVVASVGRGRGLSYHRLPEHPLRLTIVKMDGSFFDVQVTRFSSVLGLKFAIEHIFSRSPKRQGTISWSHVWSHFCLCFNDQKLVDDKACLKTFGIKDGDKLHFVRHVSLDFSSIKRCTNKHRRQMMELADSKIYKDVKASEGGNYKKNVDGHKNEKLKPEFNAARTLQGCCSYPGAWFSAKVMFGATTHFSRLKNHYP